MVGLEQEQRKKTNANSPTALVSHNLCKRNATYTSVSQPMRTAYTSYTQSVAGFQCSAWHFPQAANLPQKKLPRNIVFLPSFPSSNLKHYLRDGANWACEFLITWSYVTRSHNTPSVHTKRFATRQKAKSPLGFSARSCLLRCPCECCSVRTVIFRRVNASCEVIDSRHMSHGWFVRNHVRHVNPVLCIILKEFCITGTLKRVSAMDVAAKMYRVLLTPFYHVPVAV